MRQDSIRFLETLINTPSPSGQEMRGQAVWLDYVRQFAEETFTDHYGNAVAILNKGGAPRLMLAAHADEITMAVNYITEKGFIYVRRQGGIDPAITKAQRVLIHTQKGSIRGVVGNVAPHLTKANAERKLPRIHDLFIDIGASNRKQAQQMVRIGDTITIDRGFERMGENLAVARAFDNRAGTFAVAEALRLLKESGGAGSSLIPEVCVVSNVMEEVGLLGARQIAYSLNPDIALVVDVTHATDVPTISKEQHGDISLGDGPTITRGIGNHPIVVDRLDSVASKMGLPLQYETTSSTGGTDTDVIFWTRGGIPSALISLPDRYMHSPVEMIHLGDLDNIPRLMAGFAESIKKDEEFKVLIPEIR